MSDAISRRSFAGGRAAHCNGWAAGVLRTRWSIPDVVPARGVRHAVHLEALFVHQRDHAALVRECQRLLDLHRAGRPGSGTPESDSRFFCVSSSPAAQVEVGAVFSRVTTSTSGD